jgi:phage-related protein
MSSFIFKGIMSSEFDMSVVNIVTVRQGSKHRPEEEIDIIEIPYRNGELIIHSGKYKAYEQEFEFTLRNPALIPQINTWLSGRGKLYLENDGEEFNRFGFYMASVVDGWEYEKNHSTFNFTVKFKVDPFFYYDSGQRKKTYITQPLIVFNNGTIYSEPYIRINGSGNITLTVNSQVCTFMDIVDYIEMDSALMVAYKDTLNQGQKMTGDFPIFEVGKNNISWTGNVTSIEIMTRARELG